MTRAGTVSSDGVELAFDVAGTGVPALVFVHGWCCDRFYWRHQMASFADRHQVVAIDLAGHGESGTVRSEWTMAAFGDDVVAVADALTLDRMVLVGHSMGGDVIIEAARRLGARVAGLVWVDVYDTLDDPTDSTAIDGDPDEELDAFLAPFAADFTAAMDAFVRRLFPSDADPALVDRVSADMGSAPPGIALAVGRRAVANGAVMPALLRELAAPVVAVNASVRPTDVETLARHGVRAMVMADVGHFPMLEAPAAFDAVLAGVLAGFG